LPEAKASLLWIGVDKLPPKPAALQKPLATSFTTLNFDGAAALAGIATMRYE